MTSNLKDDLAKLHEKTAATKDGSTAADDLAPKARHLLQDLYTSSPVSAR